MSIGTQPGTAQVIPGTPFGGSGWGGTMPYPLLFTGGTATEPEIGWVEDADATPNGIFRAGADQVAISTNGNQRISFHANGFNLGLTTSFVTMNHGCVSGTLRFFGGFAPAASGATCGTAPTITGNNTLGSVTLGAAPGLPCTILFNGTWTNTPRCFLNPGVLATASTTVRATGITTSQFVITSTAALVATDKVSWLCASS